jgi:hypothetical protein
MKTILVIAAVAAVAGCQTKPVSEMSYSELMATSREIQQRCEAQGAIHPSPEFELCIKQEVRREHATRASNRARAQAFGEALAEGSQQFGASVSASRPVNCTSNRVGTSVYTNCF